MLSAFCVLFLLFCLFFAMFPSRVCADQDGDFLYETRGDPLVATITGYVGDGGAIIIPSSVGGYPTVHIGTQAFMSCENLTSVEIPTGVLTIGYAAFSSCASLTSVTLGGSLITIGNGAFDSCSALPSVSIPNSVTIIGDFAFISCSSLSSVTIGTGVTSIGNYTFESCSSLQSITIPDSVTRLGAYAFYDCTNLTAITLGDGLASIGNYAFSQCSKLASLSLPSSVTSIGAFVFHYCSSLTSITVDEANTQYRSSSGILYNKDSTTLLQCPAGRSEPVSIPSSVATIGKAAFFSCDSLTSISIPSSVDSIGDYAFTSCPLSTVAIPNSVLTIGVYTFAYCPLTAVSIGNRVNAIGNYAFASCTSLVSITFYGALPPPYVGANWILGTPGSLRGHAYASSTFPSPGGVWNGLTMGTTIDDTGGGDGGSSPSENQHPVADPSAGEPYRGKVNEEIFFNGTRSYDPDGTIASWVWDFGDNTTGSGRIIQHSYTTPGVYTVLLSVVDTMGATGTYQTTVVIRPTNMPPDNPVITGPSVGHTKNWYQYTITSSDAENDSLQYILRWGEETSPVNSSDFVPSGTPFTCAHLWTAAGRYTVTGTATDNLSVSSTELIVYIDALPTGEIGYLLDDDGDGVYDSFFSSAADLQTPVQQVNNAYVIDSDGDGDWDYRFHASQGLTAYEEPAQTPGYELLLLLGVILGVLLIRRRSSPR